MDADAHTRRRRAFDGRGRGWSDAAPSQRTPSTASTHQKLGGGKVASFPRDFREVVALLTPDLRLLASRFVRVSISIILIY